MNFAEYQERAARTAVYPHENWREYLAHGLIGEAGELSSAFAKFYRGDCDDSPTLKRGASQDTHGANAHVMS